MSQRRIAIYFHMSRTTIARKLRFLAQEARKNMNAENEKLPLAEIVEFDDQITFEHTKLKPLSITMAVVAPSRRILAYEVSRMPAFGKLAEKSRKKYGIRKDERTPARRKLFKHLKKYVVENFIIKSDESPHYPRDVAAFFPNAKHLKFKGRRGCVVGQGELKAGGFDEIFTLNHTFAMFRANINRLARRTWCTTKDKERLADHLAIYSDYHNSVLIKLNKR